jgi:outer membrane protein assembly factor BamE (lipoprotein component of BamABCDE complex)
MKRITKYGFLIFGAIILVGFALSGNITHEQFDSVKWKNWTETERKMSMRWDMMNSLRNTHELKGKTRTEITKLLGNPETKSESEFRYYLGMAKYGIDTGHLTIYFDRNKIVSNIKVHRG